MSLRTAALALALAATPCAAAAQGVSVAPKVGTTGVGVDLVLSLAPKLALKGGVGFMPLDFDVDLGGQRYRVEPPPIFLTGALDIRLAGPVRIMAGLMHRTDDTRFGGDLDGPVGIGEGTYSAAGRLEGSLVSAATAPFLGLGFGALGPPGFHVYLDLALAFAGTPDATLEGSGPIAAEPGFDDDLEIERRSIVDDVDPWYGYWPVVNLGFRIGL